MANQVLFSDDVVLITEFKKHAKMYAERARQRPLTIVQGGVADLALLPRELVATTLRRHEHLVQALDLLAHLSHGSPLRFLTWAADLNDQERSDFAAEYASAIQRAESLSTAEAWSQVNELVEDWAATAEALQNEELMEAVGARPSTSRG